MIASPGNGLCVAMEIYAEESHLDLASRAGSGHLQAGAGRQGALGLPPPVTAPVICKEDNNDEHMLIRDTRHMQQCWALAWVMTVFLIMNVSWQMGPWVLQMRRLWINNLFIWQIHFSVPSILGLCEFCKPVGPTVFPKISKNIVFIIANEINLSFLFVSPRLMSPMSFFFGPFPKLRLRDHEKKMPRFLSALSSLPSSFSDRPDLCFLASCQTQNKSEELTLWAVRNNDITHIHKEWLLKPFSGWRVWSDQSWRCVWRALGCRGSDKGLARVGHPPQHACTLGRVRTWGSVSSCRTSSGWRSVAQNVKKWGCDVREPKLAKG